MRYFLIVAFLLWPASTLADDYYKWVDKDGVVHLSNVPTKEGSEKYLSLPDRKEKKCIEPDSINGPSGQYVSDHKWSKYLECLKDGGTQVLPWKEK